MPAKAGIQSLLLALLLLFASFTFAQGVLPVPELTARVIDQTHTLDAVQRTALEQKLEAFEQQKGSQIVVLLVPTTQPEDIASYANRVANAWKIGRKKVGDGVLVIVAKDDRKVRIEVAKTLEGAIPDLAAKQIIDDAITPAFRKGDYAAGLQAGADQIIARINGEALPEPEQRAASHGKQKTAGFDWFDLAIFLFIAVPIASRVLRGIFGKFGTVVTGAGVGLIAFIVTSSIAVAAVAALFGLVMALFSGVTGGRGGMPWIMPGGFGGGGRGGGWGGGGGFSSGGGGDFGGGGASGDW
ncbi:TPM domain-containing protein [Ramlibacter sp.]|uniref:TPM domain-containing protein n=1 Tax=Ramlibacter sp. TaxID=1917967 RepID=UPI0039C961AF